MSADMERIRAALEVDARTEDLPPSAYHAALLRACEALECSVMARCTLEPIGMGFDHEANADSALAEVAAILEGRAT